MKVTVQSVAERAEVSIGTVSRVLNGDPTVSAALTRRVRESVDDLGYQPLRKRRRPAAARDGLAGKTIGLLTLGLDRSLAQLPVVTAAIDGIRDELTANGAILQWVDLPDPSAQPNWLRNSHFDGWLIKGAMQGDLLDQLDADLLRKLKSQPAVWFHGRPGGAPGDGAGCNDWEAGAIAAERLFEAGHRHVAFLSPKRDHQLMKRRQHGFQARCEELKMKCRVASKNLQTWSFPQERPRSLTAVGALLEQVSGRANPPTAIFVPADSIAVLLYRAAAERGIRIPEKVSIISVNHEAGLIAGLFPALTTIDIRSEEVGRESVRLLKRRIESGLGSTSQDVQIDPMLIEGESVLNLKSKS